MRRRLKVITLFIYHSDVKLLNWFLSPSLLDEFVTCGLDVWPCISIKEDRLERQLIEENTNDILANFLKSN